MSIRVGTGWISGAVAVGLPGFGVLGSVIASNTAAIVSAGGVAGYLYNDLSLPADNGKEICGRITSWPSAGTLTAYEDGSFTFTGPDGSDSFAYQLYVYGVATGAPATVSLVVGASGNLITVADSVQAQTSSTASITQTHLVSAANSTQANTATPGSIAADGTVAVTSSNSTQANTSTAGAIQQTHMIVCAASVQDNIAAASSIVQAHLIGVANSVQGNVGSAGSWGALSALTPNEQAQAYSDRTCAMVAAQVRRHFHIQQPPRSMVVQPPSRHR